MARQARQLSETGLYHIVFRGVNKQHIFEEDKDYQKMTEILSMIKSEMEFKIYAYCFMSNHVHLLIKEISIGDVSLIMKRLLCKYARWYNMKYSRSGALIANRYKSKPVEVDEYFLSVIRYIHQNPTKAGIVSNLDEYLWSSYKEYADEKAVITDITFLQEMISQEEFVRFHQIEETEVFKVNDSKRVDEQSIRRAILKEYNIEPTSIEKLTRGERNELLKTLKNKYSIRQLERVTGISRGVIYKC